jgi:hypothetical protein
VHDFDKTLVVKDVETCNHLAIWTCIEHARKELCLQHTDCPSVNVLVVVVANTAWLGRKRESCSVCYIGTLGPGLRYRLPGVPTCDRIGQEHSCTVLQSRIQVHKRLLQCTTSVAANNLLPTECTHGTRRHSAKTHTLVFAATTHQKVTTFLACDLDFPALLEVL